MTKINYQNLPSTSTPLNATNLNAMQNITETGSNANGNYIKYEDGTLIQWKSEDVDDQAIATQYGGTVIYFGTRQLNLPTAFYNTDYAVFVGKAIWGTGGSWGACMSNINTTTARLIFYDMFSRETGTVFHLSWMAIGRWK